MKIKAQTLQQRFGFQDDDLKSANHDEIMIWLDENIDSLIGDFFLTGEMKEPDDFGDFAQPVKVLLKQWEKPIMNGNFMIGFIDMFAKILIPSLHSVEKSHGKYPTYVEIPSHNKWERNLRNVMFEVKTSIPSLGELLRQLAMYREYYKESDVIVVCPDNRFEKALKSQGVGFIQYPSSITTTPTP